MGRGGYLSLMATESRNMSGKSKPTLTPEEQREQEDKALLAEKNSAIDEIMQLISDNHDRDSASEKVESHKDELNDEINLEGDIFHQHKGKRIPIKKKTGKLLALAEALEIQLKTHTHARDLHRSLQNHVKHKITILERQLGRLNKS